MNLKRETQEIVGYPYRYALFYNFPGGLRFELSEGGNPLDQVLTALRKATAVCEDVFANEKTILVHLLTFLPLSKFGLRRKLRELHVAGITIPEVRELWLDVEDQDDDEVFYWVNCAFEVPVSKVQNLIWCAVTTDFGTSLSPNPHCRVYLLNPSDGIVVHPYDDRGMDVISKHKSALAGLYERHKHLLLSHDIEIMRRTFADS